jgi:hypothetical protein
MQTFSSTNSYFSINDPLQSLPSTQRNAFPQQPSFISSHSCIVSWNSTAIRTRSDLVQILLCHPSCLSASEMLQSCPKVTKPTSSDALTPSQPIQDPKHSYLPTLQHILSASRHNSLFAQCLRAASLPLSSIVLQALLRVRQATIYCKHMVPRQSTYHQ